MYPITLLLRKTKKCLGRCDWKKKQITIYLPAEWKLVVKNCKKIKTDYKVHKTRSRFLLDRLFEEMIMESMLITVIGRTIFHEYLHEFMHKNNIHPFRCRGCKEGTCGICNLTQDLTDYFWPAE
jgi:hypothetical protein